MNKEKYFIILVNYCNPMITIDCIKSLIRAGCKNSNIIVVDNASTDDSYKILKQIQDIILLKSEQNNGFSSGNNIGIKYALNKKADYIILLNNDTVVAKNFIHIIFQNINEEEVLVPKIYYFDMPDTLWYAGGKIDYKRGLQVHFGLNKKDKAKYSKSMYIEYATGCCMIIPRIIIEKNGLLDESYFMYWEDMDYSIRLKNNKIKIKYIPDIKIWHKVGKSSRENSEQMIYYQNRNRFMVLKKYNFGILAWIYTLVTRMIKYFESYINKQENRVILRSWFDFKNKIIGKTF